MKTALFITLITSAFTSFGQFKCCNEYNAHTIECENFNRTQEWQIEIDSVVVKGTGEMFGEMNTILDSAQSINFKLDRLDSTFVIEAMVGSGHNVEGKISLKFNDNVWLTNCIGEEREELGITLLLGDQIVSFSNYSWSTASECAEAPISLSIGPRAIYFWGKVTTLDE